MRIPRILMALLLVAATSCKETFTFTVPAQPDTNQDVTLRSITLNVVRPDGTPVPGAVLGTIPTLNATGTERGSDGKDRALVLDRFVTDAKGQLRFANRTFSTVQSPLFFNAYATDPVRKEVLKGATFLDLEVGMATDQVLTIVMESVPVLNPGVRVALFDDEPFPRAMDFLAREGILFDNLLYDRLRTGASWASVLGEANLRNYDVLVVGLDNSRYAEFDQLVQNSAGLTAFVKNHPNKLLFLCQQHVANFTWNWVADFNVPAEGVGGGFLRSVYTAVAHFDNARLTAQGAAHPLFAGTRLADPTDADKDGVADVWEGWDHIEPNKPEIKPRVAWHAGNAQTFTASGWDILVNGPALPSGDIPPGAGVVAAEKTFPNGSRVVFCQATYYQASYGPRKATSALVLKDQLVKYLATWPGLRGAAPPRALP